LNIIPSSTPTVSGSVIRFGTDVDFQRVQGHVADVMLVSDREAVFEDPFRLAVTTAV
jgi:hypothetical protein